MQWKVILNGCHSEGLHLDVFPSPKGHVCISGTNRQHIWHCHRNMVLRMDAANEGPPVLIQPHLSITAVIIYCLHLLTFHPSLTRILLSWWQAGWCRHRSLFYSTDYSMTFWSFTSCHGTMTKSFWFDLNVVVNSENLILCYSHLFWSRWHCPANVILQAWPSLPERLHKNLCLLILYSPLDSSWPS